MVNNMYEFVEDIDKKEYEDFVLNSNKSHFFISLSRSLKSSLPNPSFKLLSSSG